MAKGYIFENHTTDSCVYLNRWLYDEYGENNELILDNGATISIVNNPSLLTDIHDLPEPVTIFGVGESPLETSRGGTLGDFGFSLLVPSARKNLLAWSSVKDRVDWEPSKNQFNVRNIINGSITSFTANDRGLIFP